MFDKSVIYLNLLNLTVRSYLGKMVVLSDPARRLLMFVGQSCPYM